jgi:hypothetical protein
MKKIVLIISAHLVAVALLFWCGSSLNDTIVRSQNSHAGIVSVFSIAFGIYSTVLNFLYQRNQAFHLFVNRIWLRLIHTHTYWQPHITMELDSENISGAQVLDVIWENLSLGSHGAAKRKSATSSTLAVALDELLVMRFRHEQNKLFMDFEQKLLVPSHLYDTYRRRLAKLAECITQVVKPNSVHCGLRVSFETGQKNPYYGLFINRIQPELLQNFQVVFRLDAHSSCRVEAGKDDVNIESENMTELFEALKKVLSLEALPTEEHS